jgi:signal transduction histidine kinase
MVMELLDFTRMQDGRMTLNVEPTDIRSEFEDTVYMYGSRLSQDGIQLNYLDNDDDIPEISCDPKRLRQVFLNILDNAAKHGGEGKRIDACNSHYHGYNSKYSSKECTTLCTEDARANNYRNEHEGHRKRTDLDK